MKVQHILIGLIFCMFFTLPVLAASNDDQPINFAGENNAADNTNKESSGSGSSNIDVWGIQKSDMGPKDYVDINLLTSVASGITPVRNASILSIALAFLGSFSMTIISLLVCLGLVGYGALHPNDEKSMKIMKTNRNKMVIIGSAFAFCLFMLVSLFFALAIFAKMNLFAA